MFYTDRGYEMKLPKENGFYKYYEGWLGVKTIVKFEDGEIFMFHDDQTFYPKFEDEDGSYFIEPIVPITFD